LWWGHRIPVWYIVGKKCEEDYIVARNEEEAVAKAQEKYGKSVEIYQDPDVLDTWFSRFVFLCKDVWYQLFFHNMNFLIA
jgi:valyl-tRNA synthetase